MAIYLRQMCLVAEQLEPVVADLEAVLGIERCYVDPEVEHFGLENTLLAIGTNFIEVVAPIREGTAAGRYLERRGGDGGYMVIAQAESEAEQLACRDRAAAANVRVAWEHERPGYRIMQLHPADMRAAFFEVDWHERSEIKGHWPPAGGDGWKDKAGEDPVMAGAELQGPDPAALAAHWAVVAGAELDGSDSEPELSLANAKLRFAADTDGRGAGLGGIDIATRDTTAMMARAEERGCPMDGNTIMIGGVRFRLEE